MGDILQCRKLGTTWEPDLENSSVKLPSVSKLWHPPPQDLRMELSSILSPDRKWSFPTPENERVGSVAWQWLQHFHREGLSADVRPNWSLLASLLPRGTVIRDTKLEMTSLVFMPSRFGCQVLRLRSLPLLREGGKDIFEFQLHMPPTFCFPCRFTDINVILCRPLPPSDALVTTNGLSSDRILLVATGAPIPLLKFMLLEQHVRTKADLKVFMAMLGIAFEKGIQVQRCYDLVFRHCFPDCSDDDLLAMVQKMFEAPTQDELIEQELDPLMLEALLAVDPEEAEHFKVTKEAFQRVDIKKKYGVKRLRHVVERNLEGDRASPMKSTSSWVHELVPTKREGVAEIHLERDERKETWTVRYGFEDSFVVPADLPRAFRQKTKSSNFQAKNGKQTEWTALRVVVWAWTKRQRVFGEFPPTLLQNYLKSKTELSWSDCKDQVPIAESEVLPAAVADRHNECSSSSDTSSSSSTESNT